ncbi:MAG: hypothetical protein EVJ47_01000 [Candidatus Acidulodesulfobacterium ferriphilum]|uniref:Uncharacterized protein n=1 Tax=Candidatus Acidulodesulfobacterium ferriphilum TaxID=2597223 RepID=A0A519BC89_9DELT|nr:MAG: hypothetical protein EVJ47_01000 [Candidatus Acidulodesulfobacterium ferriphilum]
MKKENKVSKKLYMTASACPSSHAEDAGGGGGARKRKGQVYRGSFSIFLIIIAAILSQFISTRTCFGLKNPFISPFKAKQYKNRIENPLNGITLQAIVSSSNPNKNVAIINDKPYYIGSKIVGKTVVGISSKAVTIKLENGKIVKLLLVRYEGFKK